MKLNSLVAQSSLKSLGLLEQQSNRHECENLGKPNNANRILNASVNANSKTINAKTHVVKDSVSNVCKQDTTNS